MQVRKYRWSRVYESAEEELVALLERRAIAAQRHAAEEGEAIPGKTYLADTQLWCAEGQVACTIAGRTYSVQAGDVLDIPANTPCHMQLSFGGCVWYESIA